MINGFKTKASKYKEHQHGKLNGQDHNLEPSSPLVPLTRKLEYTSVRGQTKDKEKSINGL